MSDKPSDINNIIKHHFEDIERNFLHLCYIDRHNKIIEVAQGVEKEALHWIEIFNEKLKANWPN